MGSEAPQQLRIGQVCDLLRAEFPDISISKLRFLEEQGLVEPERTPGGYRMYTTTHVRQLQHILRMQRDEFLPLKVIREELQRRMEGGPRPKGDAAASGSRISLTTPTQYVEREDMCRRIGVPVEFVAECEQYDLVEGVRDSGRVLFTVDEAEILVRVAQLARFGIEPRNLKQLQSATRRQGSIVEQFAAPRLASRNADARQAALRSMESLGEVVADLIRHMFVRDLRLIAQGIGPGSLQGNEFLTRR